MTRRGHNDGSITKRSDGRYEVRMTIDDKRRSWYAPTLKDARALLQEKQALKAQGRLLASPSQTVETYLWQWHRQRSAAVSYRTATNYGLNIRRALPRLGKLRLEAVRAAHLDALYAEELKRGVSAESVLQLHRTLRAAFNQAVKQELLYRNPVAGATPPRSGSGERPTPTPAHLTTLLRETAKDRLGLLWALLATTGLRSGEAIGLRWADVDLDRGRLTIYQTPERRTGEGICFKEPKTAKSRRTVLLLPEVVARLREAQEQRIEEAKKQGCLPPALVFTTTMDTPLDVSAVNRQFHRALTRCHLPPYRVHELRHGVITYLISRGVPAPLVQSIVGHASSRMTTEVYTHLSAEHQRAALPFLAELLPAS